MPWKSVSVMDQREEFVRLARSGSVSIAELCRRFGISRDTGHRLLRRHAEAGASGLADRCRRPLTSPHRTSASLEAEVLSLREAHPRWGGRKIARRLADLGREGVPAPSTITEILRRHGRLSADESARHRPFVRFEAERPNDLWQMDFKGHFATEQEGRCHPLTVLDDHSRYSLGLRACGNETDVTVRHQMEAIFRRHGLPCRILADNGAPWGTAGSGGQWSAFSVWLMRLGIAMIHGRPRHPQTQGKEERFHRSLKAEVLSLRSFRDLVDCQVAFDRWRQVYNTERPHEALGLDTPARHYLPSPRSFPELIPLPDYHDGEIVRKVHKDGYIRFRRRTFKLSQAFTGYHIALRPRDVDGLFDVCFASFVIAQINLRDNDSENPTVRHVPVRLSGMSPV